MDNFIIESENEEYLSDEYIEEAVESDEISNAEAWFIVGWKQARGYENDVV